MNADQADQVIDRLGRRWKVSIPDEHAQLWRVTLGPLSYESAVAAIDALGGEPALPSYRQLLEAAQAASARPDDAKVAPKPRRGCPMCGGTGWREVETAGGVAAVGRCPCWPESTRKHSARCTCRQCIPDGGGEGEGIVAPDPKRKGPHPLQYRGPKAGDGALL